MVITSKVFEITYENPGNVDTKVACYEGLTEDEAVTNFRKEHPLSLVKYTTFKECKGSNHVTVTNYKDLERLLRANYCLLNIFVGADCSGKDYVMDKCAKNLQWGTFKPNYKDWTTGDIKDRWRYFQYALRVLLSLEVFDASPTLINRSSLCGAVYNNELSIALEYGELIKDISSLHILVVPDTVHDFDKFVKYRLVKDPSEYDTWITAPYSWTKVSILNKRYINVLDFLQLPYIIYRNSYIKESINE